MQFPIKKKSLSLSTLFTILFFLSAAVRGYPSPTDHQARDPIKSPRVEPCGTASMEDWLLLRAAGSPQAERPPDGTYTSGSTHFLVHYEDSLLSGYADEILLAAERTYRVLIDTLEYVEPPSDSLNGGDGRTDIYVQAISAFGATLREDEKPRPGLPYGWSSFIEVTDTLSSDLLSAVVAHEYFHVVQLGYDAWESITLLEMLSSWLEERVYDDANTYLKHLPAFFSQPFKSLMNWKYKNVGWAIYLREVFGDDILRDILGICALASGDNSIEAMEGALTYAGSSLSSSFSDFTLWNYFTGVRDDGAHYEEGGAFPTVWIEKSSDCLPLGDYLAVNRPDALGSSYYFFLGDHSTDSLRIELILEPGISWVVSVTRFTPGGILTENFPFSPLGWERESICIPSWGECDSLLLIANVVTTSGSSNDLLISAAHTRTRPPLLPYALVLDRDGCLRPFDGVGDEFSAKDGEDFPLASALEERAIRYVLSDSIPEDLAHCGAIFIVGGFSESGPSFQPSELESLMAFMDRGGDVYLESTRLGQWMDPLYGQGSPTEEAFWEYFGCTFLPGEAMEVGNVSAWHTPDIAPFGAFSFGYDFHSVPDDFVGELEPKAGTDTLIFDQALKVRGTIARGPNGSVRIHATVLLGASTGADGLSTRDAFLHKVLEAFDSLVPVISLAYMNTSLSGKTVAIRGELEGYTGEELRLERFVAGNAIGPRYDIPLTLSVYGTRVRIFAEDNPPEGVYVYRLAARSAGGERTLWERELAIGGRERAVSFVSLFPNPSSGVFKLEVRAANPVETSLEIFDPTGKRLYRGKRVLKRGKNVIDLGGRYLGRLPSGVYFVRLRAGKLSFERKLIVLR